MDKAPGKLRMAYLEHAAIAADATRFAGLVSALDPGDRARAEATARWYGNFERVLHDHHRVESMLVFPALVEHDRTFGAARDELERQHHELETQLSTTGESIDRLASTSGDEWRRAHDETIVAASALSSIVASHLDYEQSVAFPILTTLSAAEFASLGKAAWKLVGYRSIAFTGPWVLEHASPSDREELLAHNPWLIRALYRRVWAPRYHTLVRPLDGSVANAPTDH